MRIAQHLTKTMALLAVFMLTACGQTGALYLPEEPEPAVQENQSEQSDQTEQQAEQK